MLTHLKEFCLLCYSGAVYVNCGSISDFEMRCAERVLTFPLLVIQAQHANYTQSVCTSYYLMVSCVCSSSGNTLRSSHGLNKM